MSEQAEQTRHVKTIHQLLGLKPDYFDVPDINEEGVAIADLPVLADDEDEQDEGSAEPRAAAPLVDREAAAFELGYKARGFFSKDWVRYPLIFIVALGFFYTMLNFTAIKTYVSGLIVAPAREEKAVITNEADSAEYNIWVKRYYVYSGNTASLVPTEDADGDALANRDEFYLGTNPLKGDTDSDFYDDGQEVVNGYNPLYEGKLRPWQVKIIADKIDMDALKSRKRLGNFSDVAGFTTFSADTRGTAPGFDEVGVFVPQPASDHSYAIDNFILDPGKPGNLQIPRLGTDIAIIWSKSTDVMEEDLKWGVVHHPHTVYPGARGMASIHGHSSGNWDDGNHKTVFTQINLLEPGDEVFVTVFQADGIARKMRFVVRSKCKVYSKTDSAQFADLGGYHLNLSTSWPIGTAHQRCVVTTELVGIE